MLVTWESLFRKGRRSFLPFGIFLDCYCRWSYGKVGVCWRRCLSIGEVMEESVAIREMVSPVSVVQSNKPRLYLENVSGKVWLFLSLSLASGKFLYAKICFHRSNKTFLSNHRHDIWWWFLMVKQREICCLWSAFRWVLNVIYGHLDVDVVAFTVSLYRRTTTLRTAKQLKRNEMKWNNNHSFNFAGLPVGNQRAELRLRQSV